MEITGLILNVIGTMLLFFFGFPQPNFETGVSMGLEDNTPVGNGMTAREYGEKIAKKRKIYKVMAYFALGLILLGFIVQLLAAI
jgi:hypothetical protein